ncbi:aminotransferase class IV [Paenibacillus sp. TRM 82003]|nr:aminotransferase class IV [Paenibacillus sp. TRM 82003]
MKLWLNGTIIDESEAVIPLTDHGFLYGMGLFETFRTYEGRPFLLDRHVARLVEGCAELRIAYTPSETDIREAVGALLAANGLADAYVRWSVSAGAAPLGLPSAEGYAAPNISLLAKQLPAAGASAKPKELHVLALPRSTPEGAVRRKSFHYMNNVLAKWELSERTSEPAAEGLLTDADGNAVEGVVSNVFHVRDGIIYTPSLDTGCLPGVTREAVLALAAAERIPVREGRYGWEALLEADELFVTNSIQELTLIVRLYDRAGVLRRSWPERPGEITSRLRDQYRSWTTKGAEAGHATRDT